MKIYLFLILAIFSSNSFSKSVENLTKEEQADFVASNVVDQLKQMANFCGSNPKISDLDFKPEIARFQTYSDSEFGTVQVDGIAQIREVARRGMKVNFFDPLIANGKKIEFCQSIYYKWKNIDKKNFIAMIKRSYQEYLNRTQSYSEQ